MTIIFSFIKSFVSIILAIINMFNVQFETCTVELYENPSSGYEWEYSFDETGILAQVESHYTPDPDSIINGKGGGTKIFTFRSLNSGTVNITFEYVTYSQDEKIVASKYIYTYTVDDNGKISLQDVKK